MTNRKPVRIFQIFYNEQTRKQVDPSFIPLDNSAGGRPDWAEYWPIRNKLLTETFDPDELLGFFSPRFREKTAMTGDAVLRAIHGNDAEVYSFSPYVEQCALYINPIFQGEAHHAGMMPLFEALMPVLGLSLDPHTLVSDQTTTVFSNYFVAKASLWQRWLELAEKVFSIAESAEGPLVQQLRRKTVHRFAETYEMKVFIVERLITLLLEATGTHALPCVDPRSAPRSLIRIDAVLAHLLICDALKGHYKRTRAPVYIELYAEMRKELLAELQRSEDLELAQSRAAGGRG